RRDGLVDTELRESATGPARRYYTLTASGRAAPRADALRCVVMRC
ncbi:helix-turn-helix transcriptional regulator, partial [Streptomyces sp. NPDC000963]